MLPMCLNVVRMSSCLVAYHADNALMTSHSASFNVLTAFKSFNVAGETFMASVFSVRFFTASLSNSVVSVFLVFGVSMWV